MNKYILGRHSVFMGTVDIGRFGTLVGTKGTPLIVKCWKREILAHGAALLLLI